MFEVDKKGGSFKSHKVRELVSVSFFVGSEKGA